MSRNSLSYKDWANETELWQRQFSAEICGCHNDLKRIRYFLNCDKLEEIWFRKGEVPNRPGEGRPCSGSVQGHGVAKNVAGNQNSQAILASTSRRLEDKETK